MGYLGFITNLLTFYEMLLGSNTYAHKEFGCLRPVWNWNPWSKFCSASYYLENNLPTNIRNWIPCDLPNYPVILRILGFFSSSFSRKIHYPWRPLSLPKCHRVAKTNAATVDVSQICIKFRFGYPKNPWVWILPWPQNNKISWETDPVEKMLLECQFFVPQRCPRWLFLS